MASIQHQWVFGYGSLIWRPDFPFIDQARATLAGYSRRFWQGSHDHRGLPDNPGRVVTLIADLDSNCLGMAYLIDAETVIRVFEQLDHREKNGYERYEVQLQFTDRGPETGLVYIAPTHNFAYLGEAPLQQIAAQIARSEGPSGKNFDYLFELATALREIGADDAHVFALESEVRGILKGTRR